MRVSRSTVMCRSTEPSEVIVHTALTVAIRCTTGATTPIVTETRATPPSADHAMS